MLAYDIHGTCASTWASLSYSCQLVKSTRLARSPPCPKAKNMRYWRLRWGEEWLDPSNRAVNVPGFSICPETTQ
jgi:hypothetical protein